MNGICYMKSSTKFIFLFMLTLIWVLFSQLPSVAEYSDEKASSSEISSLKPQLLESANQLLNSINQGGMVNVEYSGFIFSLVLTLALCIGFYFLIFGFLRSILRRFDSDLPLVTLGTSRGPITLVILALGLNIAFQTLPPAIADNFLIQGLEKVFIALGVLSVVHWLTQLFVKVIAYALREYAEQSEAMWDDVLVPILENTAPVVLYGIGIFIALQVIGLDLTGLWVALGGAVFVLGFAVRDILSNFFSGLVLLIDTPFRFGDVILNNDQRAVIRKIGLRTTQLYLIDTHCDVYVPNGALQTQSIVNLSRPTSHYYYTVTISLPTDVDPSRASKLMEEIVLAHPDTLGDIDHKLRVLDMYFGFSGNREFADEKRAVGRMRLTLEKIVNDKLLEVEQAAELLTQKIKKLEKGGIDTYEIKEIRDTFIKICELVGLSPQTEQRGLRGNRPVLQESKGSSSEDNLINAIRSWYSVWLKDPNLVEDDRILLPKYWEQNISLLKSKLSRLYGFILKPEGQETRLDDYLEEITFWLRSNFKSSRNEWQDPKVWVIDNYTVKFYIDDITLEHCERGNRIQSEVHREMIWHLRQAYLLR